MVEAGSYDFKYEVLSRSSSPSDNIESTTLSSASSCGYCTNYDNLLPEVQDTVTTTFFTETDAKAKVESDIAADLAAQEASHKWTTPLVCEIEQIKSKQGYIKIQGRMRITIEPTP